MEVSDLYAEGFDPVERPAHYAQRAEPDRFLPLTEQRQAFRAGLLPAWGRRLERLDAAAPIPFSGWDDWDEQGVLAAEHPLAWRP